MSPFLLVSRARVLYDIFAGATEPAKALLREFYRKFEETGALPLGYRINQHGDRCFYWVTVSLGAFPTAEAQRQHIIMRSPTDCGVEIVPLH